VSAVHPTSHDRLLEIGPGQRAITAPILAAAGELSVIELDWGLIRPLQARCAELGKLEVNNYLIRNCFLDAFYSFRLLRLSFISTMLQL